MPVAVMSGPCAAIAEHDGRTSMANILPTLPVLALSAAAPILALRNRASRVRPGNDDPASARRRREIVRRYREEPVLRITLFQPACPGLSWREPGRFEPDCTSIVSVPDYAVISSRKRSGRGGDGRERFLVTAQVEDPGFRRRKP